MAAAFTGIRSADEIQNLLVCDSCTQTIKEPKILNCSHSFCKACLEKLLTRNDENGGELNCPTCKSTTTLKPDETVVGLPDNDFILILLSAIGPNRKQGTAVCSYCQKEPPITVCEQCEMLFCHTCYGLHDTWPRNKNHKVLSLGEIMHRHEQDRMGANRLNCAHHKDVAPKFYCETCKQLVCIKCVASTHPKSDHSCLPVHKIYLKKQEVVRSKFATINAMLVEGKQALESVNNSKSSYEKTAKDIKVKHSTQKEEMIKAVTEHANKILEEKIQEVDKGYQPACQKLSVQGEAISNYLQKVERSLQRTNEVLENSKLDEMLSAQKVIDDDIEMLQREKLKNLTTFQVQLENAESCMEKLCFHTIKQCKEIEMSTTCAICNPCILPGTAILKNETTLIQHLEGFLQNKKSSWTLCYRASLHGWTSQDFHRQCDAHAPTVVLVKVGNWIFGGFTDQTWQGYGHWKSSTASFLFSLRNPSNLAPFKCPIINGRNGNAIYCYPSQGATFGGSHDLAISSNANTNQNSNSNLGYTYQPPLGYQYGTQQTQSLLAGSNNFQPTEIEVFY